MCSRSEFPIADFFDQQKSDQRMHHGLRYFLHGHAALRVDSQARGTVLYPRISQADSESAINCANHPPVGQPAALIVH